MNEIIKYEDVESKILTIRGEQIILDRDVADLYGVETKDINRAVNNNPYKFPESYIIFLEKEEWKSLRLKFLTLEISILLFLRR